MGVILIDGGATVAFVPEVKRCHCFFALYFLVKAYSNGDTTTASTIATAIAVTAFASELT